MNATTHLLEFDVLLSRADESTIQSLLGEGTLEMLLALEPDAFSLRRLRELLMRQKSSTDLLADKASRSILLELLRPQEARALCLRLGLNSVDPYSALRNLHGSKSRRSLIFSAFGIEEHENVSMNEEIAETRQILPSYSLFDHQRTACNRCLAILNSNAPRVMLHMPTGSGKTRTAMHLISRELIANPGACILWLAHTEELCEQAASEFESAWTALGNRPANVCRYWSQNDLDTSALNGSFLVAGLAKLTRASDRDHKVINAISKQLSLIVFDEAHQAIAPTYKNLIEMMSLMNREAKMLGLSATPGRSWDEIEKDEKLSGFFYNQKVPLEVIGYDNPVDYLVDEGYLAKLDYVSINYNDELPLTQEERLAVSDRFEIPEHIIEKLSHDRARNLLLISTIEKALQDHFRVLVFAATVQHSDMLAAVLENRGYWARSVTGKSSKRYRNTAIDEYKSDAAEPRILCNYGVLSTGFDAPKTSCAVIARPTNSLVLYSQMIGRAARGIVAGGNRNAQIFTVVDSSLSGFGAMADAFHNWEDAW